MKPVVPTTAREGRSRRSIALAVLPFVLILAQAGAWGESSPPYPLGTFANAPVQGSCPGGFVCRGFTVSCPGLSGPFRGELAVGNATGAARGMVVFFSGGPGTAWWGSSERGDVIATPFLTRLREEDDLDVVLARWGIGWNKNEKEKSQGPALNACRAATVIRWVHDNLYVPPADGLAKGACGFCVSGNSGGSIETAYALSHYRLDAIIDAAVLTSGPPHAAMDLGCLRNAGEERLWYDAEWSRLVDGSFGAGRQGPCSLHDETWVSRWKKDSARGPGKYRYLRTRVAVIIGSADQTPAPAHAEVYFERLHRAGNTMISFDTIEGMPHSVHQSPAGLAALEARLLGTAPSTPSTKPTPSIAPSPSVATPVCRDGVCGTGEGWTVKAALAGSAVLGLAYPAYVFTRRRQPL